MAKMLSRVAALFVCGLIGTVLVPGCVIRIGPGGGGEETTQPDPAGGEETAEEPALTPEEEAALSALENIDPDEATLKGATAQYAAAACSSLVQSQVLDPANVDPETVQQLLDQYAPIANDQALVWMSSMDPSALPTGIIPDESCMKAPHDCKPKEYCPVGDGAYCFVTGCGDGKCPWCDLFGNLLYDSFCTYGCMQGSKYWGYGFNLRTRFTKNWNGFQCFPFTK